MSDLKLTGRLHKIFPTNQVSDSFKKREFVIETEGEYKQLPKFEFTQDKCSKLDSYNEGDNVTVHFNLRGRLWLNSDNKEVYFNTLSAWKIEVVVANEAVEQIDQETLPF